MVRDETTDGERIGRLLSSEIHGHERGMLGRLAVADAETDVEPSDDGAFAYAVALDRDATDATDAADAADAEATRVAEVYLHPDRARVEFLVGVEAAVEAAEREGLHVRPKAVDPPRTLVFVERGAAVKGALRVVRAVAAELGDDPG